MADDESPETGAPPKLTVGQRILTALPRIGGAGRGHAEGSEPERAERPARAEPAERAERPARAEPAEPAERTEPGAAEAEATPAPGKARPKGETSPSGLTKAELAHAIKYIDDRERRIGMFMAPLGAAIGVALIVVGFRTHQAQHLAKGQTPRDTVITLGFVAIALAAVVFLAALSRRRAFLGFALVFLGIPLNFPLLLPFWFVGGWLVFRSLKWQRELAAMNRGTGAGARGGSGRGGSGRGGSGRGAGTKQDPRARARDAAAARAARKQPAPKGPTPSKRYTPPKPTRPRPPASS